MKYLKVIYGIAILLMSCTKHTPEILTEAGIIQGKTTLVSHTNNTCTLKLKYAINGNVFDRELLPKHLFYIDTFGTILGISGSSFLTCETLETSLVQNKLFPASIFLLMDKSVTSITQSYNLDKLVPFKEAFFKNISDNTNQLEVNFGICALDNPFVPEYKVIYKEFQKNVADIKADSIAPIFNLSINSGKSNLPQSIESSIDYISTHSNYTNRILFVYTDDQSGTLDSSLIQRIISKAKANNIHIVLYSTRSPDNVLYSQRRYVNGSDGFQFNDLSIGLVWTSTYLNMHTLFEIFKGKPIYESTVRLTSNDNFFSDNNYGLIRLNLPLFNYVNNAITPLYER